MPACRCRRREGVDALLQLLPQLLARYCPDHPVLGQALSHTLAAASHCLHQLAYWSSCAPAPAGVPWVSTGGSRAGEGSSSQQQEDEEEEQLGSPALAAFLLRDAPCLLLGVLERQQGVGSGQSSGQAPGDQPLDHYVRSACYSLMCGAQNLPLNRSRWCSSELLVAAMVGWGRLAVRWGERGEAGEACAALPLLQPAAPASCCRPGGRVLECRPAHDLRQPAEPNLVLPCFKSMYTAVGCRATGAGG